VNEVSRDSTCFCAPAQKHSDLKKGAWHSNLDTKSTGLTAGIWQLIATLPDGSQHAVWIQIK